MHHSGKHMTNVQGHSNMAGMELLSPAGGMEQLKAAVRFGADAVYGGLTRFGLRASAENFDWQSLEKALALVHKAGKRFYLTLNILPYDDELGQLEQDARRAAEMGVDAAIVSDLGAFAMLHKRIPELTLHVSTQANVMNAEAAGVFAALGAKRIVLSRELSLERIQELRALIPDSVELEAFAHGAMCMAHSGRCMFSDFLAGRGGNRGACAQPCRWEYTVLEAKRPDEPIPVMEDERGTYLFSAYDLNMLSHLPEMQKAGICSIKIEGRMKTAYYVAGVTHAYRKALDLLNKSEDKYRAALPGLQEDLLKISHRRSNTGFYFGAPQPASGAEGFYQNMEFSGRIVDRTDGAVLVEVKNRFHVGDPMEILSPGGISAFTVTRIVREDNKEEVDFVSVAGQRVWLDVDAPAEAGDYLRGPNRNHRMEG